MESRQLNDISFLIIQAAIEVHRTLGPGLLESVYRTCMIYELRQRNLDVIAERLVPICYKEVIFEGGYRLDLQVADQIIVEIKAMDKLTLREEGQLLNYLKATGMKVGVLINFGHFPNLEWKRLVFTKEPPSQSVTRTLGEDHPDYQTQISDN